MTAVASLCVAFYFSWKLTLVILTTIPVSIVILSLATRKIEPAIQMQKKYLATASKHATASLMAIDLVKVFGGYDQELKRYLHFANLASNHYLVQALCNSIQLGYVSFWLILTFVVGFWYGAALIDAGLSPGSVMSTFYAVLTAFQGAEALIPHWLVFSKGMSGGKFLSSVMPNGRRKGLPRKMGGMLRPQICAGTIELRDVSSYCCKSRCLLMLTH
jgi:ATP-binding cassette subfamily B (MDR/TAP) protein 1